MSEPMLYRVIRELETWSGLVREVFTTVKTREEAEYHIERGLGYRGTFSIEPVVATGDVVSVFRMQYLSDGIGAYDTSKWYGIEDIVPEEDLPGYMKDDGWPSSKHPGPISEGLGDVYEEEIFGFRSEQQLKDWFFLEEDCPTKLEAIGLVVVEYKVDTGFIRYGSKQVVFLKTQANKVTTNNPTNF